MYNILFEQSSKFKKPQIKNFRALNGFFIPVVGSVNLNICLSFMPNVSTHFAFHILNNSDWSTHLVLGRDFLEVNNLTLIYNPTNLKAKSNLRLIKEVTSADEIDEEDTLFGEIKTDFGLKINKQVRQVINKRLSYSSPKDSSYCKLVGAAAARQVRINTRTSVQKVP